MTLAVVQREAGAEPEVHDVDLGDVAGTQVRVRVAAAGVCHTDLSISRGVIRHRFPVILGHEGAGTVVEVGPGVEKVQPGQRVVVNWSPACRRCWYCQHGESHLCEHASDAWTRPQATLDDGTPLYAALGTGAFAEEAVVDERAVVALPSGLSTESAALLGCAVLTGVGAVVNSAAVRAGDSVAVFGLGGIGLSAVQGARLAGAHPIIAVDVAASKEQLATRAGATAFIQASDSVGDEIRALTSGRGVDHAFECVGRAAVMRQAWSATRRGGRTTVVGVGGREDTLSFNALELFHYGRTFAASVFGDSDPDRDVPRFGRLAAAGQLDLDGLITAAFGPAEVPRAYELLERGEGARTLIIPDGGSR